LEGTGQLGHLDMEYNIKIHNQEVRCEDMYCIYLFGSRQGTVTGYCESSEENWFSIFVLEKATDILRRNLIDKN
jgi:hypothetical protein